MGLWDLGFRGLRFRAQAAPRIGCYLWELLWILRELQGGYIGVSEDDMVDDAELARMHGGI